MTDPGEARNANRSGGLSLSQRVEAVPRAAYRLSYLLAATMCFYCVLLVTDLLARAFPARFESKRRAIALAWLRHLGKGIGMRMSVYGPVPQGQVFLASNHVTWQDIMTQTLLPGARPVVMAQMKKIPILGRFFRALDCVFVSRRSGEVPRVNAEIGRRLQRGQGIMLAPEGVISPGRSIQRYRAALLEAPARTQCPVHYSVVHYHTPPGWPPPSESVLFGPDPYYRTPEGAIPQEQLEMWGPPRMFLPALFRLLGLPYHRFNLTFGKTPITHSDRIGLANALHAAAIREFHPIE